MQLKLVMYVLEIVPKQFNQMYSYNSQGLDELRMKWEVSHEDAYVQFSSYQ